MSIEQYGRAQNLGECNVPEESNEREAIPTWIAAGLKAAINEQSAVKIREALVNEPPSELTLRLSGRIAFLDYLSCTQATLDDLISAEEPLLAIQDAREARDTLFNSIQQKRIILEKTLQDQQESRDISRAQNYLNQASDDNLVSTVTHFLHTHALHVYNRSHPELIKEWASETPFLIVEKFTNLTSEYMTIGKDTIEREDISELLDDLHKNIQKDIDLALIAQHKETVE